MEDVLWSTASPGAVTEAWNLTGTANMTVAERLPWQVALDKAINILMTINTITLMLGMGSAVVWRELLDHLRRPIGAVIGMMGQFLVLPATGFVICIVFQLRPYESLGLLVVSCCPGGIFSNFFTFWADGDLALSIMMTTCSSLMAFGGMPFNLWLYSHYWLTDDEDTIVIPFGNIMISLAFTTIPVLVGMVIRHYHERAATIITRIGSLMGWVGALTSTIFGLILYWRSILMAGPLMYLAAFLLPFLGFLLAYGLAKVTCQTHKVARTIGIETGSQNTIVAATIIFLSFSEPTEKAQVIIFPALYVVTILVEALLGIAMFQVYKRKCARGNDDYKMTHTAKIKPGISDERELEALN